MQEKHLDLSQIFMDSGDRQRRATLLISRLCAPWTLQTHSLRKFKDYIAIPKGKGTISRFIPHCSDHTVLRSRSRSARRKCNKVAESGVASHWIYKSGNVSINDVQQRTHLWLKSLLKSSPKSGDSIGVSRTYQG